MRNTQLNVKPDGSRKCDYEEGGNEKLLSGCFYKKSITNTPISIHHIANHLKPPETINFFCSQINSLRARKLLASSPK